MRLAIPAGYSDLNVALWQFVAVTPRASLLFFPLAIYGESGYGNPFHLVGMAVIDTSRFASNRDD